MARPHTTNSAWGTANRASGAPIYGDEERGRGRPYLRPPAGQDKVGVDVLLSELLGHVEPQGAVFVVDVALGGVVEDGVGVVDLLELVGRLGVVGILVGVELQRQFPEKETERKKKKSQDQSRSLASLGGGSGSGGASPVRPLDVVRRGHLLDSQHVVEGLACGGQGALPLVLSHDL